MNDFGSLFDGSWFDILSALGGVFYAILNRQRLRTPRRVLTTATALDILNGMSIVPLLFLAAGLLSTTAIAALIHFNRAILAAAAVVALFAIVEER